MVSIRSALILTALLVLSSPAIARPLVAVLDFGQAKTRLDQEDLSLLSDVARGAALESLGGTYDVITRENLETLLRAQGKSLAKCLDGSCETDVGRDIGAELIVSGRIVKAFGAYKVNLKLHRTDPPKLLGAQMVTVSKPSQLEEAIRTGTMTLCGAIEGARKQASSPPSAQAKAPAPKRSVFSKARAGVETARSAVSNLASEAKGLRQKAQNLVNIWDDLKALADNSSLSVDKRVTALERFVAQLPKGSPYREDALDLIASLKQSRRYWSTKTEWASLMVGVSGDEHFGTVLAVGLPLLKSESFYWQTLEAEIGSGRSDDGTWTTTVGYHQPFDLSGRAEFRLGLGVRYQSYRGPEESGGYCCEEYSGMALVPEVTGVFHIASHLSAQLKFRYVVLTGVDDLDWAPTGIFLGSAGLGF